MELQKGYAFAGLIGYAIMGIVGIWAIFLSPYYHRDTWHGVGYAVPFEIIGYLKESESDKKRNFVLLILGIAGFSLFLVWSNWEYILNRVGFGRESEIFEKLTSEGQRSIFIIIFALILFLFLFFFLVRWDNLGSSLKNMLPLAFGFWIAIVVAGIIYAMILNDWSKFKEFQWLTEDTNSFLSHASFYTIWGLLQQWLFLGYFNTRIRKGVENRKYGLFSGKIITSLLTGVCFGAIHIPAWPLSILTFIGGFLFGLFYQNDKNRNLFIMGFVHGVGGTLVGQLTPIIMVVGPWVV